MTVYNFLLWEVFMKKKFLLLAVMLFFAGSAFGLGPLGKPTAGLTQGQWRLGGEYGYGDMDIDVDVTVAGLDFSGTIEGLNTNTFQGRIGYGLCDGWELYGLVGAADAEVDFFDGGYNVAYGVGSKVTLVKDETISWGVLFQIDWFSSDDSGTELGEDYDIDLDLYEIIVAFGPTYSASENCRIYGGPLFYMLEGDLDIKSTSLSIDMSADAEIDSQIGGYIGAEFDLDTNAEVFIDFVFTGDVTMVGGGISWKM
jgi:hypothetical protein